MPLHQQLGCGGCCSAVDKETVTMPRSHRRLCMHKSFVDCIHCSAWKIAAYQAMLSLLFCVKDILLFSCILHKKDLLCVAFSACFCCFVPDFMSRV